MLGWFVPCKGVGEKNNFPSIKCTQRKGMNVVNGLLEESEPLL